jgi:ubiquinone/menaquinone biosynthesis C-methylase UbiE
MRDKKMVRDKSLEKISKIYFNKTYDQIEKKIASRRFRYIAKYAKGEKILDIGCKDAIILKFLDRKVDYTGIDVCNITNRILKNKGIKVKNIDVSREKIPFPNKFFDTVIMGEIIEHLENPFFTLKEVKRVLKDDGVLIGTTTNTYNIQSFIYSFITKPKKSGHLYTFKDEELANLLRYSGFEKIRIERICSRIPFIEINLPDKGIFKLFSTFFLFVCFKK